MLSPPVLFLLTSQRRCFCGLFLLFLFAFAMIITALAIVCDVSCAFVTFTNVI